MKKRLIGLLSILTMFFFGTIALTSCDSEIEKVSLSELNYTYTGNEIVLPINESEAYTIYGNFGTTVGTYHLVVALNKGYVWSDNSKESINIDWQITEKLIEKPVLKESELLFNTHEQVVEAINQKDEYFLFDNRAVEVGSYIAKARLIDTYNYSWEDNTKEDVNLPFTITPILVEIPSCNENLIYNGRLQTANIEESEYYTISENKQINSGTYNAVVSLTDKINKSWEDGTKEDKLISYTIEKLKVDIPVISKSTYMFNGLDQQVGIEDSEYYQISDGCKKNAGSYEAVVSLVDLDNLIWEDGTKDDISYSWKIKKALLAKPELVSNQLTYVGREVSVSVGDDNLFKLTGGSAIEIGSYTVTISLKDKNNSLWLDGTTDDYTLPWEIVRTGKVAYPDIELYYNGKSQNINSYSCYEYTIVSISGTNAGEYNYEAELNHPEDITWLDGSTSIHIGKWKIKPAIFDGSSLEILDSTYTYDGTIKEIEISGYIPEQVAVYKDNGRQSEAGIYEATIYFVGWNPNYEVIQTKYTRTLTINKATFDVSSVVTFKDKEEVYDGREKQILISGTLPSGITPIYENNSLVEAGEIEATVSFQVNGNYNDIDTTMHAKLTVKKGVFDVSNVIFNDQTVGYNGKEQVLTYSGYLPEGIQAIITGGKGTELGLYEGTISFEVIRKDLFEEITTTKKATLTIVKGDYDLSGISFADTTYYYNKLEQELVISGTLPNGVSVSYYTNKLTGKVDSDEQIDAYAVFAITDTTHYNVPKTMHATLTITPMKIKIKTIVNGNESTTIVNRYTKVKDVIGEVEREGYYCDLLYDKNGKQLNFESELTEDTDVDVKWIANTYHITYRLDEGSLANTSDYEVDVVYDKDVLTLPTPTHSDSNYEFVGWYDFKNHNYNKFANGTWTYANNNNLDVTLYGLWSYKGNMDKGVSISATDDSIVIKINDIGITSVDYAYIYAMNASAYYYVDTNRGISTNIYRNTESYIGVYKCYSKQQLEIPRYQNGIDYYNMKYYIANGDSLVKGPLWVVDIDSLYDVSSEIESWGNVSKKGLFGSDISLLTEADVNYGLLNVLLNGLIKNNEEVNAKGEIVTEDIDWSRQSGYEKYNYNGVDYYFDVAKLSETDNFVKACSDNHIEATLILLMKPMLNQYVEIPYFLQYQGAYEQAKYCGLNSSNPRGADYYGALMNFIVERYSNGTHGYVSYYVLGNEIDFPTSWNAIGDMSNGIPSVEVYTEEYYRNLRMLSQAIRKNNNYSYALTSYSHFWGFNRNELEYQAYTINELLISKSNAQGNFDWGIASHSYPFWMTDVDGIYSDLSHSNYVSYSYTPKGMGVVNLEVYDKYLDRNGYYLPNGEIRPVVMTESGATIGSYADTTNFSYEKRQKMQAAVIAYTYYKAEMSKSIKAYIYYKDKDNSLDGGGFGMLDEDGNKRLSYEMWKDIDKSSTDKYISYINELSYCTSYVNTTTKSFASNSTYLDVIKLTSSLIGSTNDMNWDDRWNKMKARLNIT